MPGYRLVSEADRQSKHDSFSNNKLLVLIKVSWHAASAAGSNRGGRAGGTGRKTRREVEPCRVARSDARGVTPRNVRLLHSLAAFCVNSSTGRHYTSS